jgi:hypothetical protein
MPLFSKDDVLRSMRRALGKLKDNPRPRYPDLLLLTIQSLAAEDPSLEPDVPGHWHDVVTRQVDNAPLAVPLVEAYWYLISMGYVVPEPQGNRVPEFNGLRITGLGHEWARGDEPSPEDQLGFLAALKAQIPQVDPIIGQYVQEAVAAYARMMFFASAVMIGAASEKTIYLLMDALGSSVTDLKEKAAIIKTMKERGLPAMFKRLQDNLTHAKKVIPWEVHEGADAHLLSLQEAIRVQRNTAVHPQAGKVTPQTVRLTLASFPGACKKAYDLIEWFKLNKV